ncbi:MAG: DUF4874 domain-containing protein [Flavobacterium sp.]|nr:MAG: DUF4874 domain-containing protein [Flavobacterium sp.]
MKKFYFLSLLAFCALSFAQNQTVTYTPISDDIANPERGFYHHTETHSGNYTFLNAATLQNYRNQENITLIMRVFYLESYINSDIPQSYLNKLQTDFNTIRSSGLKVIVRFAYSDNNPAAEPKDAPKNIILNHIQQLRETIYNNRDVLNSLQVGFIGIYGEWYASDNFGTNNLTTQNLLDRQEVLLSVLENFGWDIQIQVRTPKIKQNVFGTTPITLQQAYSTLVQKARVGHYNDCFLSSPDDQGTFNNETERIYLENDAIYTVNGGETCAVSSFSSCSNALQNLNRYSFDFLNMDYNAEVIEGFVSGGCFDEIKRRLGYRLELISSALTPGTVTINLRNTGFGHLANERKSYVVYRNINTGNEISLQIDGDARLWVKGQSFTISQNIPLLPVGTYHLYLNLPDQWADVTGLDQRYSVRFANANTWENSTGYNDLGLTLQVTALSIADFLTNTDNRDFKVEMFDINGRKITTRDVESLARGIYIIRRTDVNGAVETRKILL